MARPLTTRPLDLIYFLFFIIHIPATILIDLQALYPRAFVPALLQKLIPFYLEISGDPLIGSAFNYHAPYHTHIWFRSFLWLEFFFQLPVFIIGARGLWKDSSSIYVLMLIYGASTSTTLLPCLATVLAVPTAAEATTATAVTTTQRLMLLSSYVPFLIVPFAMTLDMACRLSSSSNLTRHARNDTTTRIKREE